MSQPLPQPTITAKVTAALRSGEFITTASLARGIGCGRDRIVDAYDVIEAAGIPMMRVRGVSGGVQFLGRRMRRAA